MRERRARIGRLLEESRLARLYTFVLKTGEVTIDDIVAGLGIARTTAYSDAETLVDLGVLSRAETQKTHTYGVTPIVLTADLDGDAYTIAPTLIEAIGRSPRDEDLDLLVEKYGLGKLAAALTYAVPYVDGEMTERIAARELDLYAVFAVAVCRHCGRSYSKLRSHDLYFDRIRNAREHPPIREA